MDLFIIFKKRSAKRNRINKDTGDDFVATAKQRAKVTITAGTTNISTNEKL